MIHISIFFQCFIIGVLLCIPIGPVALLIIQKTIHKGKKSGAAAAFGSISGDMVYSTATVFGISFISSFIHEHLVMIKSIGALAIAILGIKTYVTHVPEKLETDNNLLHQDYFQAFILTASNLLTFIAIAGFFAAFDIDTNNSSIINSLLAIIGIACGEFAWWHTLIFGATYIGQHASEKALKHLNKIAGIMLIGLSLAIIASITYKSL